MGISDAIRLPVPMVLLTLGLPALATAQDVDWPVAFQNPGLTRVQQATGKLDAPAQLWSRRLGGQLPRLLVQDVLGDTAKEVMVLSGGRVECRTAVTGALLWATPPLSLGAFHADAAGLAHDMDGDGVIDILVSKTSKVGNTRVYCLAGDTGAVQWTFGEGLGPSSGTGGGNRHWLGDVDGDGKTEYLLYVSGNVAGATIWAFEVPDWAGVVEQWTAGGFSYLGTSELSVFDATGDGNLEVLVSAADTLVVYDGKTGATLSSTPQWTGAASPIPYATRLTPVQVDGDSALEFTMGYPGSPGIVGVWELDPLTKGVVPRWTHPTADPVRFGGVADIDGDGLDEVVLSEWDGVWRTRVRQGAMGTVVKELAGHAVVGAAADTDGDGSDEVFVVAASSVSIAPIGSLQRWRPSAGPAGLWPTPLISAGFAAAADIAGDDAPELLVYRDLDEDGVRDALEVVSGGEAEPKIIRSWKFPKGRDVTLLASADQVVPPGDRQTLIYASDGFVDVLDSGFSVVGVRIPTGGFAPGILVSRTEVAGPMRAFVPDSTGRLVTLDLSDASPLNPPALQTLFGAGTGRAVLAVVDVDADEGDRELLVYEVQQEGRAYVLFEADGTTERWRWSAPDATSGPELGTVGAGGDLDGDGVLDFAVVTRVAGVRTDIPLSGADGQPLGWTWVPFQQGSFGLVVSPPMLRDVDGDGLADVIVSHYQDTLGGAVDPDGAPAALHALRGTDGTLLASWGEAVAPQRLVAAELDGDPTTVELLASWWNGTAAIRLSPTTETLWSNGLAQTTTRGTPLALDIDGDDLTDLVEFDIATARIRAWDGPTGQLVWERQLSSGGSWLVGEAPTETSLHREAIGVTNLTGFGHPSGVFASAEGRLYALNLSDGSVDWSLSLGVEVGSIVSANTGAAGVVELLVAATDGRLYAVGRDVDLGAVPEVRDGLGADADLVDSVVTGITPSGFAANWDLAVGGGGGEVVGYFVRLETSSGAVVTGWSAVEEGLSFEQLTPAPLTPGVVYRVHVRPFGAEGVGQGTVSDGFSLLDSDGDGLLDGDEATLGTDPGSGDSDEDGLDDWLETWGGKPVDTDQDGTIDALDTDSDDDSLPDEIEGEVDTDSDGLPDYRDDDDDADGIPTAVELADAAIHGDPDGDGVPAHHDENSDGDADTDAFEGQGDADEDGIPNYLDPDDATPKPQGPGEGSVSVEALSGTETVPGCSSAPAVPSPIAALVVLFSFWLPLWLLLICRRRDGNQSSQGWPHRRVSGQRDSKGDSIREGS